MFLLSDAQLKDEAWLEDVNNLLNGGEVPNMFSADERAQVRAGLRCVTHILGPATLAHAHLEMILGRRSKQTET